MENTLAELLDRTYEADFGHSPAICTMCGKPIDPQDTGEYGPTRRCRQCRFELDTDSGPIPVL